jgi:hypothetical protein
MNPRAKRREIYTSVTFGKLRHLRCIFLWFGEEKNLRIPKGCATAVWRAELREKLEIRIAFRRTLEVCTYSNRPERLDWDSQP